MLKKLIPLLLLAAIFVLFVLINVFQLDPDFGWHVKLGEYILKHGIPKTDPFSYTMPSYPFVDHEWLSNIVIYSLYQWVGYGGLAVVYALLVVSVPLLVLRGRVSFINTVSFLLIYSTLMFRSGIRPQVESWVFFSMLLGTLWNEKLWKTARWFVPLLLLLWVNMHGSFPLGLLMVGVYVFCRAISSKHISRIDLVVVVLSVSATFVNPYGWRSWWEVFMQMTDPLLHRYILEWLPFYTVTDLGFIATVCFLLGMFGFFRKNPPALWKLVLLLLLFIVSLGAVRHMPFFVIIGATLMADYFVILYTQVRKTSWGRRQVVWVHAIFIIVAVAVFVCVIGVRFYAASVPMGSSFYPKNAVRYLQKHTFPGNLFNYYTWGGYLIWKLPQKKVFIDGRMPSFRFHNGKGESNWILNDYVQVIRGAGVIKMFNKYNIRAALLPRPHPPQKYNVFVHSAIYLGFMHDITHDAVLVNLLMEKGWHVCYKDFTSVLLVDREVKCT